MTDNGPTRQPAPAGGRTLREPATTSSEPPAGDDLVGYLLAAAPSRRPRGLLAWTWIALSPIFGLGTLAAALNGDLGWSVAGGLMFATAVKLHRTNLALDTAVMAVRTRHLTGQSIGGLVSAMEWPNGAVQGIARLHVMALLPQLTPEQAGLLTEEQKGYLYQQLRVPAALTGAPMALAVLEALPQIGDEDALPAVRRLARLPGWLPGLQRVHRAALGTLLGLEQHIGAQRAAARAAADAATQPAASVTVHDDAPRNAEPARRQASVQPDGEHPGMRLGFLIAAWTTIVPGGVYASIGAFRAGDWLVGGTYALLALAATQLHRVTLTSKQAAAGRELARLDSVEHAGRVCEMLEWPDMESRHIAQQALGRLLPRLKASDAALLSAAQKACLYRALKPSSSATHQRFLLDLLSALEQIGDADGVPFVQRLADAPAATGQQRKVRAAARECLPFLIARADQTRMSQTLLRPSGQDLAPNSVLLRAVRHGAEEDAAQLLRPRA